MKTTELENGLMYLIMDMYMTYWTMLSLIVCLYIYTVLCIYYLSLSGLQCKSLRKEGTFLQYTITNKLSDTEAIMIIVHVNE